VSENKKISISSNMFKVISKRIEKSNQEFSSVDEYVEFILNEIFEENSEEPYNKDEEEEIRKHLQSMGYL
jgi:guanylate kinase|tara:strand:+ start:228 stop:437 length:210 start_codon:yes stop_codon:yes gene_type:complete